MFSNKIPCWFITRMWSFQNWYSSSLSRILKNFTQRNDEFLDYIEKEEESLLERILDSYREQIFLKWLKNFDMNDRL